MFIDLVVLEFSKKMINSSNRYSQ